MLKDGRTGGENARREWRGRWDMNRITKNASWLIACKLAQMLLGLVVSMMSARYLGPGNYGIISYAVSVVSFISPLVLLGLNSTAVQQLVSAPESEGQTLGTMLLACTVTALGGMAAAVAVALVLNAGERETVLVVALYSVVLLTQAWEMLRYWFQAKLLARYYAVVSLVSYVAVSGYKIYLLATGKSVYWFALSYALDYLLIAAMLWVCYRKAGGPRLSFSSGRLKAMLAESRYYILPALLLAICVQADKILLGAMIDETATGYYSAASVCAGLASFVFVALTDSFRPVILAYKREGQALFEQSVTDLYSLVLYMALAVCLATTALAGPMIGLTYGAAYAPAIPLLRIAVWNTVFSYLGIVRNIWILAEGKQRWLWLVNLTGAVTGVALNALLIPVMGAAGAALASVATQLAMNVGTGFFIEALRPGNRLLLRALDPRRAARMLRQLVQKPRS